MKLTVFLLTAACLNVAAKGTSQNVTFSAEKAPLKSVFAAIEKQTGFVVLSGSPVLKASKPVSISASNMPLKDFLDAIFKDQPLKYKIDGQSILISPKPVVTTNQPAPLMRLLTDNPPPIKYIIRVVDSSGNPIVGATISLKKSNILGQTNAEGFFSFDATEGSSILVSHTSYSSLSFVLSSNTSILLTLNKATKELEDVVITAYNQERNEKEVGYSYTKINSENIIQAQPSNLLNALSGKVPGLQITTTSSALKPGIKVLLRGVRSLDGDNTPLIVLDGSILTLGGGSQIGINSNVLSVISSLNPNDIDNISILRGANASTLYGPEGVNGVIIINTKKGVGKSTINYNHFISIQTLDKRYPKLQRMFGSGSLRNVFGDGIYDPITNQSWGPAFTGGDSILGRPDELANVQRAPYHYTDERFKFFNNALSIQNDISFSGGDTRSHYYFGLQHNKMNGIIPEDNTERIAARFNGDRNFGIIKNSVSFTVSKNNDDLTTGQILNALINTPANIPLTKFGDWQDDHWSDHNHFYNDFLPNPYEESAVKRRKATTYSVFGNFTLQITPLKWLSIINRVGLNYNNNFSKTTTESIFYSDFAKSNGRNISRSDKPGSLIEELNLATNINNDLLLKVEKELNNVSIDFTVGNTIKESFSKSISSVGSNLVIPGLFNLSNAGSGVTTTEFSYKLRAYSFLGNLLIGYKKFAYLELSGRKDVESRVQNGKAANFYYGASFSTILNEAIPSLSRIPFVSYIKLRAAFNKTANFNFNTYSGQQYLYTDFASGFPYPNLLGYRLSDLFANSDTKPEKILSQEYGGEFHFWKDRILVDLTYYRQLNKGLINSILVSSSIGYQSISGVNLGTFRNTGWEFVANINPLFSLPNGFKFEIGGNLAINNNKVLSLYKDQKTLAAFNGFAMVGNTFPLIRISDYLRDSSGRVIVNAITGLPSQNPEQIIKGRGLPEYISGINFRISWKNLALTTVAEYRGGYFMVNSSGVSFDRIGITALSAINGRQRFVFPNSAYWNGSKYVDNTDIVVNNAWRDFLGGPLIYNINSNYYASAAFWKIREMVLTYKLPIKSKLTKDISISLIGRNLWSFYPDTNLWGDSEFTNIDIGGTRFWGLNLKASF